MINSRLISYLLGFFMIGLSIIISAALVNRAQSQNLPNSSDKAIENTGNSGLSNAGSSLNSKPYSEEENLEKMVKEIQGFRYDPTGRRDPFRPYGEEKSKETKVTPGLPIDPTDESRPSSPLQLYDVSQFKIVAMLWDQQNPKALVLDPNGKQHILKKQTKVGRNHGFVAEIREGEIVVVEPIENQGATTVQTRILSFSSNKEANK